MDIYGIISQTGLTTLEDAKKRIAMDYPVSDIGERVRLKCWLYYIQSRDSGGKKGLNYELFKEHTSVVDYVEMIKGYLIDCSDVGGSINALRCLSSKIAS